MHPHRWLNNMYCTDSAWYTLIQGLKLSWIWCTLFSNSKYIFQLVEPSRMQSYLTCYASTVPFLQWSVEVSCMKACCCPSVPCKRRDSVQGNSCIVHVCKRFMRLCVGIKSTLHNKYTVKHGLYGHKLKVQSARKKPLLLATICSCIKKPPDLMKQKLKPAVSHGWQHLWLLYKIDVIKRKENNVDKHLR